MDRTFILLLNVLIIASCGLIYELQAATLSSFVLGDSVTQYSLVIGVYLFALGIGAWLSGFVDEQRLARVFLEVELGVALLGGLSVPALYLSFNRGTAFLALLYGSVLAVGTLVGLELPLLMRIVREKLDFKDLVARVLTFDYVGALAASLLFPLLLVPRLGLVRTSLCTGMINALVALWGAHLLRPLLPKSLVGFRLRAGVLLVLLAGGVYWAESFTRWAEEEIFDGEVVFAKTTPYQRIVVTKNRMGFQLYLNAHLQFASYDEYRYHEALVHPAMMAANQPHRILILGGGDGLALREVLRYRHVRKVTLVDIDPQMTRLSADYPPLARLNNDAYEDSRVTVVNEDALIWLQRVKDTFDAVIIDFPDPHHFSLGKLYTTYFYKLLQRRMSRDAAIGIQSTSPLATRRSYWCIVRTLEAAGFSVKPYTIGMASFGIWGFTLAKKEQFEIPTSGLPSGLRFLDKAAMVAMFVIPVDVGAVRVKVNRLDNQHLVRYYESERRRGE